MTIALKTTLATLALACGLAFTGVPAAQAGGGFGFKVDNHGNASISLSFGDHGGGYGGGWGGKCSQNKALGKAKSLHVKNRWIQSVGQKNIVVRGTLYGDDVKVVMRRNSANCQVKNLTYI